MSLSGHASMNQSHSIVISAAEMQTEEALIARARSAVGIEAWTVGECASVWTQRYARGRTDEEFAIVVGLSREQICARRNVFERFNSHPTRNCLSWSHYNVALSWEDADECLEWAADADATVAEMRAWRRAQRGEDLFAEMDQPANPPSNVDPQPQPAAEPGSSPAKSNDASASSESMSTVQREGVEEYTPFRSTEGKPREAKKKKADKKNQDQISPATDDPDRIADAMDKALKRYSSENQQKAVQRLLSRLLVRHDSVDVLLPRGLKSEDCVDQIRSALDWSLEQLRQCQWTPAERDMTRQLAEAFTRAAVAATELATGEQSQMALFDPGPADGARIPLSEVLRVWNEHFESASIPTDKRRSALKARLREPFFVAHWREAMERARRSEFCCGKNDRGWVANIDWFLRPDTVVKIMEGNHDTIEASSYSAAERREQDNFDAIRAALEE
jgi:hypothetical protein